MELRLYSSNLNDYLKQSETIDYPNNNISDLADKIYHSADDKIDYIKRCYEFVRDKIAHTADINADYVARKASEVLAAGHGICYAKSHLLAALLRYKQIPAGFCYQKLILSDIEAPYIILHGLNGVYIEEYSKWIRLDARGNKAGVRAEFSIFADRPAFHARIDKGEEDIPLIFPEPDKNVLSALNGSAGELWERLPAELYYNCIN